jgi:ribose transport system substrate-binding protein
MKKTLSILLTLGLVFSMVGCGNTKKEEAADTADTKSTEASASADSDSADGSLKGKKIVYLAPSKDILYWQWVEEGVKQACEEEGVEFVTYDAQNSTTTQASNVNTAITQNVAGIILSPVSSTSCPTVLDPAEEANIPVTIAAIGAEEGVTNYACCVTADDYTSGYDNGKYLCERVKELGGSSIGVLALPMDRTNAQNKMAGLEKACEEAGVEIVQVIQTPDLTVSEATSEATDLLTAHPDIKGIYGMYEQAGTGAVLALETAGLTGKISVVSSDGSPESIALLREGKIDGIVVQEAVGQGLVAAQELFKAIKGEEIKEKDIPLPEPLVTTENVDDPEIQEILRLVYPESAGSY